MDLLRVVHPLIVLQVHLYSPTNCWATLSLLILILGGYQALLRLSWMPLNHLVIMTLLDVLKTWTS